MPKVTGSLRSTRPFQLSYSKYSGIYSLSREIQRGVYRMAPNGIAYGTAKLCVLVSLYGLTPSNTLVIGDMPRHTLCMLRECVSTAERVGTLC